MSAYLQAEVQRLSRKLDVLQNRFDQMFKIGQLTAPTNEQSGTAISQIQFNAYETHTVFAVQDFGFASAPPLGSQMITLSVSGDAARKLAFGSHNAALRPLNTPTGGAVIYDATGTTIRLGNNGTVAITIGGVAILTVDAAGLVVTGSITASGDVIGTGISLDMHHHTGGGGSSSTSGPIG